MSTAAPARNQNKALTVVEKRAENARTVRTLLDQRKDQLIALLGKDFDHDRFITVALHAVSTSSNILDADPLSVMAAIRDSAYYNLEPSAALGEGAIVAYKGQAQFQPMTRGLMKLARRSGEVGAMDAQIVYEKDAFEVDLGTDPRIVHRPAIENRGGIRLVYAWARLRSGELLIEYMTPADIERVRESSSSYRYAVSMGRSDSIWHQWPEEMMRKSALKRLMKRLPLEVKALEALAQDNAVETRDVTPRATVAPSPAMRALRGRLGITAAPEPSQTADDGAAPVDAATEDGPAEDPGPSLGQEQDAARGVDAAVEAPAVVWDAEAHQAEPAAPSAGSVVTEPKECASLSPYGDGATCTRDAGHAQMTCRGADGSTWTRK